MDEVNEKVYIIKDYIYDENWLNAESWCDEDDVDNCIVTLNINEGPYITYGLNDPYESPENNDNYTDFWYDVIQGNQDELNFEPLVIDGTYVEVAGLIGDLNFDDAVNLFEPSLP